MRKTLMTSLTLLLLWPIASTVRAQEPKPSDQKSNTPATSEIEEPKNEVEKMLAEAKKHGETIFGTVIDESKQDAQAADGVDRAQILSLPKPAYPPIARAAHATGEVDVRVIIDYDGKVIAAAAVSGHPLLQAASVRAAREALFAPAKLNGQPVRVTGVIRYTFSAQ
jgi:TonB family protein